MTSAHSGTNRVKQSAVILVALSVILIWAQLAAAPPQLDFCDDNSYCVKVERTDLSLFSTVRLWVDVRDKAGTFVEGLTQDNFTLFEDRIAIKPASVIPSKAAEIRIHFVLDVEAEHQAEATRDLEALVQALHIGADAKNNQGALWDTKSGAVELVPFTRNGGMLVNRANPVLGRGATSTKLEELLRVLVDKYNFKKPNADYGSRQAIIVFTSAAEMDWEALSKIASEKFMPMYVLRFDSLQTARTECIKAMNNFCLHQTELSVTLDKLSADIEQRLGQNYQVEYKSNLFPAYRTQNARIEIKENNQKGQAEFALAFIAPTEEFAVVWDQLPTIIIIALTLLIGYCATFAIYLHNHILDVNPSKLSRRLFKPIKYGFTMTSVTILLAYGIGLLPLSLETLPNNIFHPIMVRGTKFLPSSAPVVAYEPTSTLAPTFTPSPTVTPSATPTPTATPTLTLTSTATPSLTHTPTPTITFTATNTLTPFPTPTPKPPDLRWGQNCLFFYQFITEPKDLTTLPETQTTLIVKGTTALPDFGHYQIDLFHPPSHITISGIEAAVKDGKTQINSGTLGSFDLQIRGTDPPQWLASGWYIIRLRVAKNDGNYLEPACYSRIYIPAEHPVE